MNTPAIENFQIKPDSLSHINESLDPSVDESPGSNDRLDSAECVALLGRIQGWEQEERARQRQNRYQQQIDADFYDGLQWDPDDAEVLRRRNQAPLVYNRVALAVNWLIGTEIRNRTDWKILPRGKDDVETAATKTKVFKYVSDTARVPMHRSATFRHACKVGVGWMEIGINPDPTEELIFVRHESWRNVLYDSRSEALDYDDGRYLIRRKWLDYDIGCVMYPDRRHILDQNTYRSEGELAELVEGTLDVEDISVERHDGVGTDWNEIPVARKRVLVKTCWYKVAEQMKILRGGALNGEVYDPKNPSHTIALSTGESVVVKAFRKIVRFIDYCNGGVLAEGRLPYKHNRIPMIPMWARKCDRDGAPYGMIRPQRDAQESYNKRASKAIFRLSTNRVSYEQGTFVDDDKALGELRKPDGEVEVNVGRLGSFKVDAEVGMVQGDLELMNRDATHMEASSGIMNEQLGMSTHAVSGKAILARQDQGSVTTAEFFDNYRLFYQLAGEQILSLIEQYYTEERIVRITDEKGKPEFVAINTPAWNEKLGRWEWLNDITKSKADFIVAEQDFRESIRQAMVEEMLDLIGKIAPALPQAALQLMDFVVEQWDVPGKDEMVKRVRKIAGLPSPDEEKTDEERQAEAEAVKNKQMMGAIEMATAMAKLEEMKARIAKLKAEGGKIEADELLAMVTSIYTAMQAGQVVASVPHVAPAADQVLEGAGFRDRAGQGLDAPPMSMAPRPTIPDPMQTDGAAAGIETPQNDGVLPTIPNPTGA